MLKLQKKTNKKKIKKKARWRKTDSPGFLKNKRTNTVINTNMSELSAYHAQRAKSKRMMAMELEISDLKEIMLALLKDKKS